MNDKANGLVIFFAGVIVGSLISRQLLRRKYEQLAQEEIDSVKEVFSKMIENSGLSRVKADLAKEKPGVIEYASILHKQGYTNYSRTKTDEQEKSVDIYVIMPQQVGDTDYETISLTYYADDILTDSDDEVIDDVESVIGHFALSAFGEYEDDSVYVRDDRLKIDYEILRDLRNYSDVVKTEPLNMEE